MKKRVFVLMLAAVPGSGAAQEKEPYLDQEETVARGKIVELWWFCG